MYYYCLEEIVYSHSLMSLLILAGKKQKYLSGPGTHLLSTHTPCNHLFIWRCTKASLEIMEVLQFYPQYILHYYFVK